MALPAELLSAVLAAVPARRRLVVGVSGGVDSMLLLDLVREHAVGRLPVQVVHVHHGLHPHAGDWALLVERTCAAAGIPCTVCRVTVGRSDAGPEAAARAARYAAFGTVLQPGDALLLAHHADDQAETLLLRLLRGSGLSGLGAMRTARPLATPVDCWLLRPLLALPRSAVLAEATRRGLSWVEDPANADPAPDRNFLRHDILPRLAGRWPATVRSLAGAAQRLAEADALLNAYLDADLQPLLVDGGDPARQALAAAPLAAMPPARARALLRRWLARAGAPLFSAAWLDEVLVLAAARADAEGELHVGGWEVHRHRGCLHVFPQLPPLMDPPPVLPWSGVLPLAPGPAYGRLLPDAGGLALALPAGTALQVRFRSGGERFRPAGGAGSRPLKKVLQDLGVPPWLRARIPLLYAGDTLVAVGDLLAAAGHAAPAPDAATLCLRWERPGA